MIIVKPGQMYRTKQGLLCKALMRSPFTKEENYKCAFIDEKNKIGDCFFVQRNGKHKTGDTNYELSEIVK